MFKRAYMIFSFSLLASALANPARAFLFEMGPLLQLVSGQLEEIERLSQTLGVAKDQLQMLAELNDGCQQEVEQLEDLEEIVQRTQSLDPSQVKSISDLNDLLDQATSLKSRLEDILEAQVGLANQTISASALQSDTAYRTGEDLTWTGAQLAVQARTASPGRAQQISAASNSAAIVAQGVELQTLSQMTQLQAMTLEFEKIQFEREIQERRIREAAFVHELSARNTPKGNRHD